jgi:hypothetical protein
MTVMAVVRQPNRASRHAHEPTDQPTLDNKTNRSCTVVASDKTGTLTQNKMTVSHLWIDGRVRTTEFLTREGNVKQWDTFSEIVVAGSLCNMCKYEVDPNAPLVQGSVRGGSQGTLRNFHLIAGADGANNMALNNYTLSKKPTAQVGPTGSVNSYQSTLMRRQAEEQQKTILNPNFFDRGCVLCCGNGRGSGSGSGSGSAD